VPGVELQRKTDAKEQEFKAKEGEIEEFRRCLITEQNRSAQYQTTLDRLKGITKVRDNTITKLKTDQHTSHCKNAMLEEVNSVLEKALSEKNEQLAKGKVTFFFKEKTAHDAAETQLKT
jgi:hypothetical protein